MKGEPVWSLVVAALRVEGGIYTMGPEGRIDTNEAPRMRSW